MTKGPWMRVSHTTVEGFSGVSVCSNPNAPQPLKTWPPPAHAFISCEDKEDESLMVHASELYEALRAIFSAVDSRGTPVFDAQGNEAVSVTSAVLRGARKVFDVALTIKSAQE